LRRCPWPMMVRWPQKGQSRGSRSRDISVTPDRSGRPFLIVR
jgi:hypothetical protein